MSKFKSFIFRTVAPSLRRLGFMHKSDHLGKNELLLNFFTTLKRIGFQPKHIVDVGANHGTWTREALKYFPSAYFTLIEPQERLRQSVKDLLESNSKISFHSVGAGEKDGSFKFTIVDRDDSCSFAFSEEEAKEAGFPQIEIPVVSLNNFLPTVSDKAPDIIKIDAEGLDIQVLRGASDFFGKTEVFMVEAGVVSKVFDNSIASMIAFMDQRGYRLFEITDLNRPFALQVLWLVELVFVRKNGLIDSKNFVNQHQE